MAPVGRVLVGRILTPSLESVLGVGVVGADPASVALWITATEAERARYQAIRRATRQQAQLPVMSREEIAVIVAALSDLLAVLHGTNPADKARIYTQLGLRLTYQPENRAVRA